jgi:beta-phosphoglucomutase-like phosphatase (HAD superfamily)
LEIEGLLFDLDGTLIDTQMANMKAYNLALTEYGFEFELKEFALTQGIDSRSFLAKSFPLLTNPDIDRIRKKRHQSTLNSLLRHA